MFVPQAGSKSRINEIKLDVDVGLTGSDKRFM